MMIYILVGSRTIAPRGKLPQNPKTNPKPNPNPNRGEFSLRPMTLTQTPQFSLGGNCQDTIFTIGKST